MLSRTDLHEYQRRAVDFILEHDRCGLALDMGLGKTVSTLTAISDLFDQFAIRRVLVIAPLRVCNTVWKQEARKWAHLNHLNIAVATGTESQRVAAVESTADIVVMNRENLVWLVKRKRWPFDMVVIDESSSFKNPSSKRFRALKKALPRINKMVLLSGTPAPNGLADLWSQQYLIDFGESLGKTLTSYRERFFVFNPYSYQYTPKKDADGKIHALLSNTWVSMSAADYLELPERIDLFEFVDMPNIDDYRRFERDLFISIQGEIVEAANAAVLAGKLLQWCNGAIYNADGSFEVLHDAKIDALREIVEENPSENILIAYNFKHDLERLKAVFTDLVVLDKSQRVVDDWNAGKIRLLAAHPQSAGHGLNLQDGGAFCVWFGLVWSLEYYAQFNARLHRQGQTRPVKVLHILTRGGIDERVISVLQDKESTQQDLLNALASDNL